MTTNHRKTPRRQAGEMFPVIKRYLECSLTQEEFCKHENLTPHVFHYWLKKYKQQKPAQSDAPGIEAFLPLKLAGMPPANTSALGAAACEIALPTGIVVRFGQPLKPEQLAQFIVAIGA